MKPSNESTPRQDRRLLTSLLGNISADALKGESDLYGMRKALRGHSSSRARSSKSLDTLKNRTRALLQRGKFVIGLSRIIPDIFLWTGRTS